MKLSDRRQLTATGIAGLAIAVLATVLVPAAASSPALAQSDERRVVISLGDNVSNPRDCNNDSNPCRWINVTLENFSPGTYRYDCMYFVASGNYWVHQSFGTPTIRGGISVVLNHLCRLNAPSGSYLRVDFDGVESNIIQMPSLSNPKPPPPTQDDRRVVISWGTDASNRSACPNDTRCLNLSYEYIGNWPQPPYSVECWVNGRRTAGPFQWSGKPHTSCYYSGGTVHVVVDGVRSNTITWSSAPTQSPVRCDVVSLQLIRGSVSQRGEWASGCISEQRERDGSAGSFARLYEFSLSGTGDVTIDLESDDTDAYLYLLDSRGQRVAWNDDNGSNQNSRISRRLGLGAYRLEATTFHPGRIGSFVVRINADIQTPPSQETTYELLRKSDVNTSNVKRDADSLRRVNGRWYPGKGGGTGRNGYWYTSGRDSIARWDFGYLQGVYRASFFYPRRDANRPPTASPEFRILQWDPGSEKWLVIRTLWSNVRDSSGRFKTGARTWATDLHLDGNIKVEVRKRVREDRGILTADSFTLKWQHLLPKHRVVPIALCRADSLKEVTEVPKVKAWVDLVKNITETTTVAAISYLTGVGLARLPVTLVRTVESIAHIKTSADVIRHAKNISEAIRVFQKLPTGLQLAQHGLGIIEHTIELADSLAHSGALGEYERLYSRFNGFCDYPKGTTLDWDTGDLDFVLGDGKGDGCGPFGLLRWTCRPGYLHYLAE